MTYSQESYARMDLSTPISYLGVYHSFRRTLSQGSGKLRAAAIVTLMLLCFLLTTAFYLFIFSNIVTPFVWLTYTTNRRHHIRAARRTLNL